MISNSQFRFTGQSLNIPWLRSGGFHNFSHSIPLHSHHHDNAIELTFVLKGHAAWTLDNGSTLNQNGDTFAIMPPQTRHAGAADVISPCHLFWLIPEPQCPQPGIFSADEFTLFQETLRLSELRAIPFDPAIRQTLNSLLAELRSADTLERQCRLRLLLGTLLLDCVRCSRKYFERTQSTAPLIRKSLQLLRQDASADIPIHTLARNARLSPSVFIRLFRRHTGMTPGDYRMRLRMDQARKLLETTAKSVTEIAFQLNFSSSQYFANVFRRFTGLTPSEYRKQHGGKTAAAAKKES
ncbi:MAG: helix-turn-helix domain-containing protein [Victivallaceae bacterium]